MTQIEIGAASIDWSQLSTKASRDKLAAEKLRAEQAIVEDAWRDAEMLKIADQLIALEDGDPDALPFTESQWRAYRTIVRAWKNGNDKFPNSEYRPTIT